MKATDINLGDDDCATSEINILPDGRICLFGASRQLLEMLDAMHLADPSLKSRIDRLRSEDVTHEQGIA
jgi:hypothetical protein